MDKDEKSKEAQASSPLSLGDKVSVEGVVIRLNQTPEFLQVEIQIEDHSFWAKEDRVRRVQSPPLLKLSPKSASSFQETKKGL